MHKNKLSVREAQEKDIQLIATYWFDAEPEYLKDLGVDTTKMPTYEQFCSMLGAQLLLPYEEKRAYALIWEADGEAIGHSNLNPVTYGEEAFMHIHIWNKENRQKGYGFDLIKMSLPLYFKNFNLKNLNCEPYALNPAPNKMLQKLGFDFVKEYVTTPGSITFEQPVKRWEMSKDKIITV